MTNTLCSAYLRVYQRLETFAPSELGAVQAIMRLEAAGASTRSSAGSLPSALVASEEREEILVIERDGCSYLCPTQRHLRALMRMVELQRSVPNAVVAAFFGSEELSRARVELESLRGSVASRRFVVQSPWHVPLRWFVAFDPNERRMEHVGDHPTIRYETRVEQARARLSSALQALSGGMVHPSVQAMVREIDEWLGAFDATSILELDYASVSLLFTPDELADDRSADDLSSAVQALAQGDGLRAALYYQRAAERWQDTRTRTSLN